MWKQTVRVLVLVLVLVLVYSRKMNCARDLSCDTAN
jgi:hypothetical protein